MATVATGLGVFLAGALISAILITGRRTPTPAATGPGITSQVSVHDVESPLRVGVYNIHTGRGIDGKTDLGRISAQLDNSDIVSLHEVKAAFFNQPDQATAIARKSRHSCLFSPSRRRWLRDYRGNALLSRLSLGPWTREPLVDDTNKNFRILTSTHIIVGTTQVPVFFTHLHTRGLRDVQLQTVFARFAATGPGPAILLGDLNVRRSEAVVQELLDATPGATDAIHESLGSRDPDTRVDWIITRGLNTIDGDVVDTGASDHPFYSVSVSLT